MLDALGYNTLFDDRLGFLQPNFVKSKGEILEQKKLKEAEQKCVNQLEKIIVFENHYRNHDFKQTLLLEQKQIKTLIDGFSQRALTDKPTEADKKLLAIDKSSLNKKNKLIAKYIQKVRLNRARFKADTEKYRYLSDRIDMLEQGETDLTQLFNSDSETFTKKLQNDRYVISLFKKSRDLYSESVVNKLFSPVNASEINCFTPLRNIACAASSDIAELLHNLKNYNHRIDAILAAQTRVVASKKHVEEVQISQLKQNDSTDSNRHLQFFYSVKKELLKQLKPKDEQASATLKQRLKLIIDVTRNNIENHLSIGNGILNQNYFNEQTSKKLHQKANKFNERLISERKFLCESIKWFNDKTFLAQISAKGTLKALTPYVYFKDVSNYYAHRYLRQAGLSNEVSQLYHAIFNVQDEKHKLYSDEIQKILHQVNHTTIDQLNTKKNNNDYLTTEKYFKALLLLLKARWTSLDKKASTRTKLKETLEKLLYLYGADSMIKSRIDGIDVICSGTQQQLRELWLSSRVALAAKKEFARFAAGVPFMAGMIGLAFVGTLTFVSATFGLAIPALPIIIFVLAATLALISGYVNYKTMSRNVFKLIDNYFNPKRRVPLSTNKKMALLLSAGLAFIVGLFMGIYTTFAVYSSALLVLGWITSAALPPLIPIMIGISAVFIGVVTFVCLFAVIYNAFNSLVIDDFFNPILRYFSDLLYYDFMSAMADQKTPKLKVFLQCLKVALILGLGILSFIAIALASIIGARSVALSIQTTLITILTSLGNLVSLPMTIMTAISLVIAEIGLLIYGAARALFATKVSLDFLKIVVDMIKSTIESVLVVTIKMVSDKNYLFQVLTSLTVGLFSDLKSIVMKLYYNPEETYNILDSLKQLLDTGFLWGNAIGNAGAQTNASWVIELFLPLVPGEWATAVPYIVKGVAGTLMLYASYLFNRHSDGDKALFSDFVKATANSFKLSIIHYKDKLPTNEKIKKDHIYIYSENKLAMIMLVDEHGEKIIRSLNEISTLSKDMRGYIASHLTNKESKFEQANHNKLIDKLAAYQKQLAEDYKIKLVDEKLDIKSMETATIYSYSESGIDYYQLKTPKNEMIAGKIAKDFPQLVEKIQQYAMKKREVNRTKIDNVSYTLRMIETIPEKFKKNSLYVYMKNNKYCYITTDEINTATHGELSVAQVKVVMARHAKLTEINAIEANIKQDVGKIMPELIDRNTAITKLFRVTAKPDSATVMANSIYFNTIDNTYYAYNEKKILSSGNLSMALINKIRNVKHLLPNDQVDDFELPREVLSYISHKQHYEFSNKNTLFNGSINKVKANNPNNEDHVVSPLELAL